MSYSLTDRELAFPGEHADRYQTLAVFAALAHFIIWTAGSLLFVSNLHFDTIEIVYWSREWLLGYGKHPLLAPWIFRIAAGWGPYPIVNLLVLAQICVSATAYFIWKSARLFLPAQMAAFAVLAYLCAPQANYYSIQINHNALLMPLWAASLYTGLHFLQRQDIRSGTYAGFAAGLAMLLKYEAILLLMALVIVAITQTETRLIFKKPGFWIGFGIYVLMLSPNVAWLDQHHWATVAYAADARKLPFAGSLPLAALDFAMGAGNIIVGQLILLIGPVIVLGLMLARGQRFKIVRQNILKAVLIAFAPGLMLAAGALLTQQLPKQSWSLVFMPGMALASSLVLKPANGEAFKPVRLEWVLAVIALPLAQFGLFMGFMAFKDATRDPVISFELISHSLARQVEQTWHAHHSGPLKCLAIDEMPVAGSPVLWLSERPRVVDLSSPYWTSAGRLADCRTSGGIAIVRADLTLGELSGSFPATCRQSATRFKVPTYFGGMNNAIEVAIAYIPPSAEAASCSPK